MGRLGLLASEWLLHFLLRYNVRLTRLLDQPLHLKYPLHENQCCHALNQLLQQYRLVPKLLPLRLNLA